MPYDFLDPNQENEYRVKARAGGLPEFEIDRYIRSQKVKQSEKLTAGLDLYEQELDVKKKEQDVVGEGRPGETTVTGITDIQASKKILEQLQMSIEGRSGLLGPIKGKINKLNPYATEAQDLQGEIDAARQLIGRALEDGVLRKEDEEKYKKILPKLDDTPAVAQRKIENVYRLLDQKQQAMTTGLSDVGYSVRGLSGGDDVAGANIATDSPALNLMGEIARPGDLIYDDARGEVVEYGEIDPEPTVFKTTKDGSDIDNAFIKFLADSEFLPIAGSITGALLGSGWASVATGAAGAVAGKAMQQGLREMFDPDQQEMSDMATAVLIEGTTDALLGGVLFGVGAVAGKGLKFIIGKSVKEGTGEAFEAGAKKSIRGRVDRGLHAKPTVEKGSYAKSFDGADLIEDIMEKFGIPKSGKVLKESADVANVEAKKNLGGLLKGKTASTKKVIDSLKTLRQSKHFYEAAPVSGSKTLMASADGVVTGMQEVPKAGYEAGIKKIDKYIRQIEAYGDEIPLTELNTIKRELQTSFTKSLETSSLSKKMVQSAATEVRKYIETFDPKIAGTNKEIRMTELAADIGERLDQKKANALFSLFDVGLLAASPGALALKKAGEVFFNTFTDPLTQARVLDKMLKMAVADGNKTGVRNILRIMNSRGVVFTTARGAVAGAGASAVTNQLAQPTPQVSPGLDIGSSNFSQEQPQPGFMYR